MTQRSLDSWLSYIESQHPSEIEMGLERGSKVLARLNLSRPKQKVITVAGTNGKGSTCAMLTQYLCQQGLSVGTYTSPHFINFNERISLNAIQCSDELICQAFSVIEAAREDIPLTYFEFSTLAALWVFDFSQLDYWVLEVGLGGRLDSVNMVDTDLAVITSISLDHVDWLGDDLNVIAGEKAGIARKGKPLISGVVNPPSNIAEVVSKTGAILTQKGIDFFFEKKAAGWNWHNETVNFEGLPIPSLPIQNAATVIAVLLELGVNPCQDELVELFSSAELTGRFQQVSASPDVYIDVAHNPEAAMELSSRIQEFTQPPIAVCGMLKDKDIKSVVSHLSESFSEWHCVDLSGTRGATAQDIIENLPKEKRMAHGYSSMKNAFQAAYAHAQSSGRSIIVFGSFVTVSEYLALSQ
ncbi:bifunctional tetrahydrofolate synthase/dihydrofolate synthase [Marinomonas sp. C2222]|uniref:Dihydrofolate synthase/folylpolyglutamate synthase n=1 Tax=Marinomonas sargassi TaxID=2984494 RepID=A0ABT2YSI7_9GAMM|nr:bifunctional tetrahydrofolate synthase/dihydrofolate synthase [Marinomonas sargassi]MCV2402836.1 bifunctional tetrahydrofolate synthase/dihydrofolate synthase [Marinomonas sargassi]